MNKTEYIVRSLSKGTHKKYETFVLNAIYNKLNNPNLEIVTQQYVATENKKMKYIDLYFPQIKVAIEVDEPYHSSVEQRRNDKKREEEIKNAILGCAISDSKNEITFIRISVSREMDYSLLLNEIDKVTSQINEVIRKQKNPLVWNCTEEEKILEIKKRGYLQRTDSFRYINDIARLFGFKRKNNNCFMCTIKLTKNIIVWSPALSLNGSNKDGWVNTISDDLTLIYESSLNKEKKDQQNYQWHLKNNTKRVTFLNYKDALGVKRRRFLGIYSVDSYDEKRNALVWKIESETCSINIKDLANNL